MELFNITGIDGYRHWINPAKISRVTIATEAVVGTSINFNLAIHLDSGFMIETTETVESIIDKLDRIG